MTIIPRYKNEKNNHNCQNIEKGHKEDLMMLLHLFFLQINVRQGNR